MQTVQLQCGSCNNMMAIAVEHLGAQVQCPHCRAVVQTPAASAFGLAPPPGPDPAGAAPPPAYNPPAYSPPQPQYNPYPPPSYPQPAEVPSIKPPERESIFSEPEPSDDLFDRGDDQPRVRMPEPAGVATYEEHVPQEPLEQADDEEPADLGAMDRVRAARQQSNLAPTLLVFLIPYAIFTTAFIAYLLYMWPTVDVFEHLRDPNPKDGPKVMFLPKHDLPLSTRLKTKLNQPVQVGQVQITPLEVKKDGDGLVLSFKAKNLSDSVPFKPMDPTFFEEGKGEAKPYTFLELQGKNDQRVYGGDLEFFTVDGKEAPGNLGPGQEEIIHLSTTVRPRDQAAVRHLLTSNGPYLWRVQVRRGPVTFRGKPVSATAVVGVEFTAADIK